MAKPYYQSEGITIYHGDCREILPVLSVDSVVTDPPYGIAHPTDYYSRGRSRMARCNDYPAVHGDSEPFDPSWLMGYERVCLFGANYYADKLPPSSGWIVWDKLRPDGIDQADAELAWTNYVKGVRCFRHLWHGMMRASEHGAGHHPTQKPVALMKWVLRKTPGNIIADPYMGSGPVLIAAKQLGRQAIGIEIEGKYCEIAAKRLSQRVLDWGPADIA